MSTEISKIKDENMVTVPKQVLQGLIWNSELAVAGTGKMDDVVCHQARELQRYIDAGEPTTGEEFSFDEFENVEFVDFRKKVKTHG